MECGRRMIGGLAGAWVLGIGLAAAQQAPQPAAPTPDATTPAPSVQRDVPAAPPAAVTAAAASQGIQITEGGTIQGVVSAGKAGAADGVPLPGVSVTATNTLTGRKYTAATDVDGKYTLKIPKNGRYVVRAELMGFALSTAEVVLNGDLQAEAAKQTAFGLALASRAAADEAKAGASTQQTAALGSGVQGLSLSGLDSSTEGASGEQGNTGATMPSLAAMNDTATADSASSGADSIMVSGAGGQMNGLANFSEDEIRQRISDAMEKARAEGRMPSGGDMGGMIDATVGAMGGMMSMAGPGGSGYGGHSSHSSRSGGSSKSGGSGKSSFRGFNPSQPHGSAYYQGDYSALDSAPWASTFRPVTNPAYQKNSFGLSFAGSPYIPGLQQPSAKQFVFLSFTGKRDTNPEVLTGVVPTTAERSGIFPSQIDDPQTGQPFPKVNGAYQIPSSRISPIAQSILNNYYPACNIAGCEQGLSTNAQNYQTVTTAGSNSANLSARYVRNFGQDASNPFAAFQSSRHSSGPPKLRMNLNANFSYSHSASDLRNIFLAQGGAQESNGYNFGLGFTASYGRFSNSLNVTWNRSHSMQRNYFTDTNNDPIDQVGIGSGCGTQLNCAVPSNHAIGFRKNFYNGLPTIQLTQFIPLTTTTPNDQIGQTISASYSGSWRKHHESFRWGFDYRRVHQDSLGGSTALGSLSFTGDYTGYIVSGQKVPGSSFADFLLGLAQQSKIEAGLDKIYLRENVLSGYGMDDWHVSDNVTANFGIRYEYFGPYSEKNNRLMNLTNVYSQTTSVGCVTPTGISVMSLDGKTNTPCGVGPNSALINPDRSMISPRGGVAWAPKTKWTKQTVFRAGYGLNFNTSQFSAFAKKLSYQEPFAAVQNNVLTTAANPTGCAAQTSITLAKPFGCSNKALQNSFAVDPNYRLGMVQVYNVDIQRTVPWGIVLNIGYNGSHGSNLDVTRAPNQKFGVTTDPSTGNLQYSGIVTTVNAVGFTYEDSTAESTFNAFTANAQKRLQHGIGGGVQYQYAHSIDDASSIGGSSSISSIQDDTNLQAERSNSSFDVRHKLSVNWVYEPPFGPNRAFLNKGGFWAGVADGWILAGSATFTSGTYFTPQYVGTTAQTSGGGTFTLRPDRDYTQSAKGSGRATNPYNGGASLRYFNTAAFSCPGVSTYANPADPTKPAYAGQQPECGPTHYGSASRYSIEGPGQVSVSASLSRSFSLGDTRNLEARVSATNVFNTVQYSNISTTVNALTFGEVTGAASMRALTFTARYRF